MTIALPTSPSLRSARVRLLDFGADLAPPLGGVTQHVARIGTRFAVDYEMPPLAESSDGRVFLSKLRQAKSDGALYPFPQFGVVTGSPGSPLVAAAASGGTTINVKGLTPGYVIRDGQFFSVIHAGRRYVYAAAAAVTASGTGIASLSIYPMLRTALTVDDVIEMAAPMIEGLLSSVDWDVMQVPFNAVTFTISESE